MAERYKEQIYNFLMTCTEPTDIEKIRLACKIGNWNTALKHCLELMLTKQIEGKKTSRGWIFWINKKEAQLNEQ